MKKIILASGSPRRRRLLERAGLNFEVVKSEYEEDMTLKKSHLELARFLSSKKAEDVASRYKNDVILAADTFVTVGDEILGKPKTPENARRMLKKISGKDVVVVTGFTIIDTKNNKKISKAKKSVVKIRTLTASEINNYVKTEEPLDKAGAFGMQKIGMNIIKDFEGDYFSVVGLPVFDVLKALRKLNVKVL